MSKSGSLAIASPPSAIEALTPPCLCIDIETPPSTSNNRFGQPVIYKLAAFRPDSGHKVVVQGAAPTLTTKLDALTEGADFVLGHNVRRHDLPLLGQVFPNLKLLALPVVDTLELSPLAFPENPYHRLVKDYKLVSDARSHFSHTADESEGCIGALTSGDGVAPGPEQRSRSITPAIALKYPTMLLHCTT